MLAKRTKAESEANTLLQVMTDPRKYKTRIGELTDRRVAAEEAEAKTAEAAKELAKREAALDERTREQDEREKGLVEREGVIAVREKSAAEQVETAGTLVAQSRERQRMADDALAVVERKDAELRRIVQDILE